MDSKLLKEYSSYSSDKYVEYNLENIHGNYDSQDQMKSNSLFNMGNDDYNNEITLYSYGTVFIDCYGRELNKDWNVLESNIKQSDSPMLFNDSLNINMLNHSKSQFSEKRNTKKSSKKRNPPITGKKSSTSGKHEEAISGRPNYSYPQLIKMAIENSKSNALSLHEIYSWIQQNFPYFSTTNTGWKNSMRHSLTMSKCFIKIPKNDYGARGALWTVDPEGKVYSHSRNHREPIAPRRRSRADPGNKRKKEVVSEIVITEKKLEDWTDTRFLNSHLRHTSADCLSVTSNTDYNDWQRAIVFLETVYPVKKHFYSECIVTPCPISDHNYSLPELHTLRNNRSLSSRHSFISDVNNSSPFTQPKSDIKRKLPPRPLANSKSNHSNVTLSYMTVDSGLLKKGKY